MEKEKNFKRKQLFKSELAWRCSIPTLDYFWYIWRNIVMMETQEQVSTFARIVDKLRVMDDDELKNAYLRLFREDLEKEWEDITKDADFGNATDEDIVAAIQKKRYNKP